MNYKKLQPSLCFLLCVMFFKNYSIVTVIDQPGTWGIGASIIAEPQVPGDMVIFINASNVIFDLNESVISQDPLNTTSGLDGIFVAPNLTNIVIRNGIITGLTGRGVYVSDGCTNVYLENISVYECQGPGILFDGDPTGAGIFEGGLVGCEGSLCTGTGGNPAYGLQMIASKAFSIEHSTFNSNDASLTSSGYGVSLESCKNIRFDTCKFCLNKGDQVGAGITMVSSHDCACLNCIANYNLSLSSVASSTGYGVFLDGCSNILFSGCEMIANGNSLTNGIGVALSNGSYNNFSDCTSIDNQGDLFATGFYLTGTETGALLLNNRVIGNTADPVVGIASGIYIDGPQSCVIKDNLLIGNVASQGYGLVDTTINTNNFIAGNLSYSSTTTAYSVEQTIGSFPAVFATVGDFSSLENISKYLNVAIVPG